MNATKNNTIAADICLYGAPSCGFGYIALTEAGRTVGDGSPKADRSATDAIWLAVLELNGIGVISGSVRVFDSGGERVATMPIARPVYYSELEWSAAPVYTIRVEDLIAAANDAPAPADS